MTVQKLPKPNGKIVVMVAGLGDLGLRIANSLARQGEIDWLVLAGRNREVGESQASQLQLIATLSGGPREVRFEAVDLEDRDRVAGALQAARPDILVLAASRMTWWRPLVNDPVRIRQLAEIPYGAWLPVHVSLVRRVMEGVRQSGVRVQVVSLPFPDAVGPALAPLGLAPDIGAGNVSEVAAKLQVLAAREAGAVRDDVRVRLVMHHAAERVAFRVFAGLAGTTGSTSEPPWAVQAEVRGRTLPSTWVDRAFHAPYSLLPGVASQEMTAAAAVQVVNALLSPEHRRLHAPAPAGLPGGYPLTVSQAGIDLDLPAGMSLDDAVAINTQAGRWDGNESIEADGTLVFTEMVSEAAQHVLGMALERVPPDDIDAVAGEIVERASHVER